MTAVSQGRWRQLLGLALAHPRLAFLLFVLLFLALAAGALVRAAANPVSSDLFALVDARAANDPVRNAATERMRRLSEQQQTWIASHPDRDTAYDAAVQLTERLRASGLFVSAGNPGPGAGPIDPLDFYARYPYRLADDAALDLAREKTPGALVDRVERALYSSTLALPALDLERDPFLLTAHFIKDLLYVPAPFTFDRGLLAAHLDGDWWYLVPARLASSAFDFDYQTELQAFSAATIPDLEQRTGASIASIGAVDYATANRNLALRETSLIGTASIVLIVLLLLGTFRNLRPFIAAAFTVSTGVAGGFLICVAVFESVHILTLVAGSSLIGIAVDYAFHLLVDGFRASEQRWTVAEGLGSVIPAVALGLATTLAGFLGLYASGFSGLQQIAVFSAGGLVTAFVGLILAYPFMLAGWSPAGRPFALKAASWWLRLWRPRRWTIPVIAVCVLALLLAAPGLETNSDIRLLSAETPAIEALQQRSATLSASLLDSRFIVVEGADAEQLLQREEALRETLVRLRNEGTIAHFNQLSQFVPSLARQAETLALNRALFLGEDPPVSQLAARIGLADRVIQQHRKALSGARNSAPVRLEDWLASPLAPLASHLWLGEVDAADGDRVASVITLGGVHDVERWSKALAGRDGVRAVDTVADLSALFGLYVDHALRALAAALTLVTLVMILRFGLTGGLTLVLAPLLSGALSLLCVSLLGEAINLFHIVGVALILGTGMDYALFLRSGGGRPETLLAVLLAALTTECAFGFLGLSQVHAIHSFGITVAFGTAFSFLLAPLVVKRDDPALEATGS